ncbi:MAG: carbohydrate ABC transporter permease [Oscillospiraceae bacterium]|jgi:putative aldouronate transport system permease protein|nr:carbohydrate ABC transporter permease [Oscillospiraceae bacterium]
MKRRLVQDGRISAAIIYMLMGIVIIITLYPFVNVLALSFNQSQDSTRGINMIWPRVWTTANYATLLRYDNLPVAARISVLRTVIGTVAGVLSAATLAYTLSRKDFVLRRFFGRAFVVTMYVSGGMIPWYMLIVNLNLNNTFWVYILPGLVGVWNVIVIRSFMDNLPRELTESAMIDGAGDFMIFSRIIFPLCTPVLATVALWIAVFQWNSWFDTFLFNRSRADLSTLQFELYKIIDNTNANQAQGSNMRSDIVSAATVTPMSVRMACTVVVTVPILMVYPFIQKYFVSGMTLGAVKS